MLNIIQFGAQPASLGGKVGELFKSEGFSVVNYDLIEGYDVTREDAVEDIFRKLPFQPEIIINYVGKMYNESIVNMSSEKFLDVLNTNCLSLMLLLKHSAKYFSEMNIQGRFIHIASNASMSGFSGMGAYCASKFGDIGLIQVAAKEWMKFGGIVNAISPGPFSPESSDMSKNQVQQFMKMNNMTEKQAIDMLVSRIPLRRLATVNDLYPLVKFLAADATNYITGQNFSLTGGMFMK
jgi:NAD(P)-dependent dehydrogenase (short-subunit alcohol dehydrogenase family)